MLNARDFGAPQNRNRLIITGSPCGRPLPPPPAGCMLAEQSATACPAAVAPAAPCAQHGACHAAVGVDPAEVLSDEESADEGPDAAIASAKPCGAAVQDNAHANSASTSCATEREVQASKRTAVPQPTLKDVLETEPVGNSELLGLQRQQARLLASLNNVG